MECIVFKRQHSGISERNLSADFPYMSVSLIERRWLSITWLQGRRYLRTPPTQIHQSIDKNETHCHNDWNQWMYPIHINRAYSNLRCMDTWEWAATWHLHSSGTVESGRGSTIPYRAVTHRDEYWSFPNQWPTMNRNWYIQKIKCDTVLVGSLKSPPTTHRGSSSLTQIHHISYPWIATDVCQ